MATQGRRHRQSGSPLEYHTGHGGRCRSEIGKAGAQMAVQIARRRFTVEGYERIAEAGILREDDRVELIDGEIV